MADTVDEKVIDADFEDIAKEKRGRRGDGGVYLAVADETHEAALALRYAAHLAKANRGHIGILHVMNIDDVQQWENIEARMRREMRAQAEKYIWSVARRVNEINGMIPSLYIQEGSHDDVLIDVINRDLAIKMLVLGGGTSVGGPGPLVSYFTGKGLGRLRVPVVVVPGHLDPQKIDAIS